MIDAPTKNSSCCRKFGSGTCARMQIEAEKATWEKKKSLIQGLVRESLTDVELPDGYLF